jgi:hypothetical protein
VSEGADGKHIPNSRAGDDVELEMAANELLDGSDLELMAELALVFDRVDPMPAGLVERVGFTLTLAHLDLELARCISDQVRPVGARGEERARTVTFTAENVTVMVTITQVGTGLFRMDGWLAPGGGMHIELRLTRGSNDTHADDDGRFVFARVPAGLAQLVFHPTEGGEARLLTPVVTPAIEL